MFWTSLLVLLVLYLIGMLLGAGPPLLVLPAVIAGLLLSRLARFASRR